MIAHAPSNIGIRRIMQTPCNPDKSMRMADNMNQSAEPFTLFGIILMFLGALGSLKEENVLETEIKKVETPSINITTCKLRSIVYSVSIDCRARAILRLDKSRPQMSYSTYTCMFIKLNITKDSYGYSTNKMIPFRIAIIRKSKANKDEWRCLPKP